MGLRSGLAKVVKTIGGRGGKLKKARSVGSPTAAKARAAMTSITSKLRNSPKWVKGAAAAGVMGGGIGGGYGVGYKRGKKSHSKKHR